MLVIAVLLSTLSWAAAQGTQATGDSASQQPPAPPAANLLNPEQLAALVAPIALYPDSLLVNVLAAATYPLEVVQADRWATQNKNLKGDQLKAAVGKQAWDDSIKALVATPSVLSMMSQKLDWTQKLGDALLAQQPDVMDAIQSLRTKAYDNKKLTTTRQQKVTVQQDQGRQTIVIEPAVADQVYVPYYDPATVYGSWPYADYPPYYFGYPSYIGAGVIAAGLAFGTAYAIGRWGNYWGGGANWGNRNFFINRSNTINNIGNNWQHNPAHRQGVRYNNANVQQRFGNNSLQAGAKDRMDFRGRGGEQVLRPNAGDRQGLADRGDRGDRGGNAGGDRGGNRGGDRAANSNRGGNRAANRAGDRGGAGNRGGGGNRNVGNRGGGRNNAMGNISSGRAANLQSARGRQSFASARSAGFGGGAPRVAAGGGGFRGGGGGGFRGGGGGGGFRGGGGGGRRSDLALKHDVVLLGYLANGLGYYRFSYIGSDTAYVGVIAQEVERLMPEAVTRGRDGYLRVYYEKLGLKLRLYRDWLADGAQIPTQAR
ncbi:DUF3300 domain-containing protein [Bradyrhizobium sp. Tv2a-2]|uniref:DUF3300 domain-containing protein n=1 Tax=Bradyrhizobium sp. Tv2a-2 TaxID=113395 RepID=UPI0004038A99|nr:DUF3300 domain-containing protein [Bradyrhizobium sp. Tv2a-2]